MQITVLTVGQNKFPFLKTGEMLYVKRLSHYTSIKLESVKSEKQTLPSLLVENEAKQLLSRIRKGSLLCVLDSMWEMLSSEVFARTIQKWQNRSISHVCFCIGGPYGLSKNLIRKADFVLSLSPMTFPHDLVRIIFLEQLYRAFTILKGEKYHK